VSIPASIIDDTDAQEQQVQEKQKQVSILAPTSPFLRKETDSPDKNRPYQLGKFLQLNQLNIEQLPKPNILEEEPKKEERKPLPKSGLFYNKSIKDSHSSPDGDIHEVYIDDISTPSP